MNILVLGSCGYIGSSLCPLLLRHGHNLVGVDNLIHQNSYLGLTHLYGEDGFEFHHLDVRVFPEMKRLLHKADVVVFLAALVGASLCDRKKKDAVEINLESVKMALGELSPGQRKIFLCTNSGYGKSGTLVTEDSPMNPVSLYGHTKVQAEKEVLDTQNSVSLRLGTVFGVSPRMRWDLLVNDFVYRLRTDERLELFEPGYWRSILHVKDACRAILHTIQKPLSGPYNVASNNITKMDLAKMCCALLGLPPESISIRVGEDPDQRDYAVSSARIMDTGFKYSRTPAGGILEVNRAIDAIGFDWAGWGKN